MELALVLNYLSSMFYFFIRGWVNCVRECMHVLFNKKLNALLTNVLHIEYSQTCIKTIPQYVDDHEKQITNYFRMSKHAFFQKDKKSTIDEITYLIK